MHWKSTNDIAFKIALETVNAVNAAQSMIRDAENASRARMTAARHTNCRHCQAELENFLIEFPDCSDDVIEGKLQEAWETCGVCSAEYHAHLERQAAEWEERFSVQDCPSDWEVQHGLS